MRGREARLAAAVADVVAAALEARGAARLALLDDGTPEAALAARWLLPALGPERLLRVSAGDPGLESLLHAARGFPGARGEVLRMRARLAERAVAAHPANKTALLLGGPPPPERILPLGDLWGSQVRELAGGWSAPDAVVSLAERAGGVERLDAALARWLEERDPEGLDALPPEVADEVRARFALGRADRVQPVVVPKLTARTLGADLFE